MSSALPTTGPISFSEIQRILGGENPISLSEYYANAAGGYAVGVPGIPTTGAPIPVSAFRGKAKASGVPYPLFSSLTSDVPTAVAAITAAGVSTFATPTNNAVAELLVTVNPLKSIGQFDVTKLAVPFKTPNTLCGTFFLNGTRKFSIVWTFTDGTNSMDTFFKKTTSGGAMCTFKVYDAAGVETYTSATPRKWNFSNGMGYSTLGSRLYLSADDGIWGANAGGDLDGNSASGLNTAGPSWGLQNLNASDSAASGLFIGSTTVTTGTALALIYF